MSKEQAQQALQEALVKTYFSNLEFLKDIDPSLHKRLIQFSEAIETGLYKERYTLEFLEDQGEFDIFDKHEERYLYDRNPKKKNNQAVTVTNFDQKGIFSILEKMLYEKQYYKGDFDLTKLQEPEESLQLLFNDVYQYVDILNDDTNGKKNFKTIDKFIFLGTLLGRHIPRVVNKVKAKVYFVHEPNLEIFRLSLFVLDYTILLANNANVKFSIMDDDTIFETHLSTFFNTNSWSNHTIKYYTTDYNVTQSFHNVMNAITSFKPTTFNYFMMLYCIFRNMSERVNQYQRLTFPLKEKADVFNGKPVLYVCAGPSLGDNFQWLEANQDKFIIVTIGSAYKKLLAHDIKPDIIVTLDSKFEDLNEFQFDDESCKKIQDTVIFASTMTDERILNKFNPDKLYIYDVLTSFTYKANILNGFSVGEIGYHILLELGVQELYLLGTDLAVDQKSGASHSSGAATGVASDYDLDSYDDSIAKGHFDMRKDLIQVKGNFDKRVFTNRSFNNSINYYNKITYTIKQESQNVYNLSNHGAYFDGIQPLRAEEVTVEEKLPKDELLLDVYQLIHNASIKGVNDEEKRHIEYQIDIVSSLLVLLEKQSLEELMTYKSLKDEMIIFNNELMENRIYLSEILSNYCSVINVYIDYCFNDTKTKKEHKKVQQIHKLWYSEVKKIVSDYLKYLQKALNSEE